MKKFNVNANLLALLMLISLFAGWEYMIIVTAFIWVFCESSKNLKDLTIRAIAIYAGCYLFNVVWILLTDVYGVAIEGLNTILSIIANFGADSAEFSIKFLEFTTKLTTYFLTPLDNIVGILGSLVTLLILYIKFKFIVSTLSNKPITGVFGFVQKYINSVLNFANSNLYEEGQGPVAGFAQPAQPVQGVYQQPMAQPMPQPMPQAYQQPMAQPMAQPMGQPVGQQMPPQGPVA